MVQSAYSFNFLGPKPWNDYPNKDCNLSLVGLFRQLLPDLDRKLYLASLEMKGELPEVMTHDSESEW